MSGAMNNHNWKKQFLNSNFHSRTFQKVILKEGTSVSFKVVILNGHEYNGGKK